MGNTVLNGLVTYTGSNSDRGPSPAVWGRIRECIDPNDAYEIFDDFLNFNGTVTTNVGDYSGQAGGYRSYEDSGGSITNLATEVGGVIRITTDNTDNDEMWLQPGSATSVFGKISDTAGDDKLLIFEARVRLGQTATGNAFIGLTEEGLAAADTITDAGAWADKDAIGFLILEDDSDGIDFIYKKAGQTLQTKIAVAQAVTADTWYKLAFMYDPNQVDAKKITVFVDGVDEGTYVTATDIAAATFPDGEELQPLFGIKNSSGAVNKLDVDWYRVYQSRA